MAAAGPGTRRIMLRWPLVLAVVLLLVGAAGFAAPFTFAKSGSHDSDGQEITSRAKDFAATYNTYSYDDLDDYQKRMKSLLTDSYNEQFVEITNALFQIGRASCRERVKNQVMDVSERIKVAQ